MILCAMAQAANRSKSAQFSFTGRRLQSVLQPLSRENDQLIG